MASHVSWSKHVNAEKAATQAVQTQQRKLDTLDTQVNTLITQYPQLSVSVATVSNGQSVRQYGSKASFDGASTAKLLTAAAYLHRVDLGKSSLSTRINGSTARQLLETMLVNSDDAAWVTLNDYLSHAELVRYAASIGFTDYDVENNTFTASDVASLLGQLYKGSLLSSGSRSLMLGHMKRANYREYIVAAAPSNATTYHKIGMDGDTLNDSAIISQGDSWYVVVIFTDGHGTYNWSARNQLFHTITTQASKTYLPSATQSAE